MATDFILRRHAFKYIIRIPMIFLISRDGFSTHTDFIELPVFQTEISEWSIIPIEKR